MHIFFCKMHPFSVMTSQIFYGSNGVIRAGGGRGDTHSDRRRGDGGGAGVFHDLSIWSEAPGGLSRNITRFIRWNWHAGRVSPIRRVVTFSAPQTDSRARERPATSNHETAGLCRAQAGPPSATLTQLGADTGSTSSLCCLGQLIDWPHPWYGPGLKRRRKSLQKKKAHNLCKINLQMIKIAT